MQRLFVQAGQIRLQSDIEIAPFFLLRAAQEQTFGRGLVDGLEMEGALQVIGRRVTLIKEFCAYPYRERLVAGIEFQLVFIDLFRLQF
jgi:hypothetical protein